MSISVMQTSTFVSTGGSSERHKFGTAPCTAPELIEFGAKRNLEPRGADTGIRKSWESR